MELTGLHLLLTYQCTLQCEHCFVFGSPWQEGTMSLDVIENILQQGKQLGTIKTIYFEGGEPFLYYPTLLRGVEMAYEMGFSVGLVSNGFWGISEEDAFRALSPMRGKVSMLSLSCDQYHWDNRYEECISNIEKVAEELGIGTGVITIAQPEAINAMKSSGTIPPGESTVMFRGRAAVELSQKITLSSWENFDSCPHEDFLNPGRVHIDPLGYLHICQGITIGNLLEKSLDKIWAEYDAHTHPITGPILKGGPIELAKKHGVEHADGYADVCHFCFEVRSQLRDKFPVELGPDQMYKEIN